MTRRHTSNVFPNEVMLLREPRALIEQSCDYHYFCQIQDHRFYTPFQEVARDFLPSTKVPLLKFQKFVVKRTCSRSVDVGDLVNVLVKTETTNDEDEYANVIVSYKVDRLHAKHLNLSFRVLNRRDDFLGILVDYVMTICNAGVSTLLHRIQSDNLKINRLLPTKHLIVRNSDDNKSTVKQLIV